MFVSLAPILSETQQERSHDACSCAYILSQKNQQVEEEEEEEDIDEALSNPFVRKSLKTLKEVPSFYDHILELIATQRRSCVTKRFLLALTSGYNGMPPIEMKAHDPVNYVGDMLAFLFRSFSMEVELTRSLLVMEEVNDNNDNNTISHPSYSFSTSSAISPMALLSNGMSGLTRPLKPRILQVITSLTKRGEYYEADNTRTTLVSLIMRKKQGSLVIAFAFEFWATLMMLCVKK